MRVLSVLFALTLATPAAAWQAGVDGPLCTLEHTGNEAEVRLTYDPSGPEYTISITTAAPWPGAPVFVMLFEGGQENMIATSRHNLSADGRTLSVADRGFGNVLNGLEFNVTARAQTGDASVAIDLTGAAPEVAAFRACRTTPSV